MCDTAGSAAAPTARRKNVRRNIFMCGGDMVSLLLFSLLLVANRSLGMAGLSKAQRALLPSNPHQSVPPHPPGDSRVPLISPLLCERLPPPQPVPPRPVPPRQQHPAA